MSAFTYPGVYIQELSSGVHTITGVATSIAAFVGWAPQGPTTEAVLVQSFSDYQRQFGGLDARSYLGYAVNQFFANGGQQAYIERLAWTDAAVAKVTVGGLTLWALGPGIYANGLQVTVTPTSATAFNLQVLDNDSQYVTFVSPATGLAPVSITVPTATATVALTGGLDGTVLQAKDGINGTSGDFEIALNVAGAVT